MLHKNKACRPKCNEPKNFLKNWRPISLHNVSHKVTSTAIALKIKTVLPKIISEEQKGFFIR